jgi:hypothetical protein
MRRQSLQLLRNDPTVRAHPVAEVVRRRRNGAERRGRSPLDLPVDLLRAVVACPA